MRVYIAVGLETSKNFIVAHLMPEGYSMLLAMPVECAS